MYVKKRKGKVYGGIFSADEKKALDIELDKQIAEHMHEHNLEVAAMCLWVLHEKFGFGTERLRRFYDGFCDGIDDLTKYYVMTDKDAAWLCNWKLKEYGIDIEAWDRELKERKEKGNDVQA